MLTRSRAAPLIAAVWRDLEQRCSPAPLIYDAQVSVLLSALLSKDERAALENHPLTAEGSSLDVCAVRTRLLDRWLEKPTWPPLRTTRRQTVILGAATDTRPYRFGFSRYVQTVFEVDPDDALLEAKHEAVAAAGFKPRCDVRRVGADLSNAASVEAKLDAAGFDPRLPTRWVAESFESIPPQARSSLFALACRMGGTPGSGFAAQVLEPSFGELVASAVASASASEGVGAAAAALHEYEPLAPVDATLGELQATGWTGVRAMRQAELAEACVGRRTHEGFKLVFAEADPLG